VTGCAEIRRKEENIVALYLLVNVVIVVALGLIVRFFGKK
jgi:hypothetical protein